MPGSGLPGGSSLPIERLGFCVGTSNLVLGTSLTGQGSLCVLGYELAPGSLRLLVCLPHAGLCVVWGHRGRGGQL